MNFEDIFILCTSNFTTDGIPFHFANEIFVQSCEISNEIYYGNVFDIIDELRDGFGVENTSLSLKHNKILDQLNNLQYTIRDSDNLITVEDTWIQQQLLIKKHFNRDPILQHLLYLKSETMAVNKINFLYSYHHYVYNILPFIGDSSNFTPLSPSDIYDKNLSDILYHNEEEYLEEINKDLYSLHTERGWLTTD